MEIADVMEFVSLFHVYEIDCMLSVRPASVARSSVSPLRLHLGTVAIDTNPNPNHYSGREHKVDHYNYHLPQRHLTDAGVAIVINWSSQDCFPPFWRSFMP